MTKVAVLISGQPRNVEECWENINSMVIQPNNADVFVHSWVDPDMVGQQYRANWVKPEYEIVQKGNPEQKDDVASNPIPENIDKIILELYKPKKWFFHKTRKFEVDPAMFEHRAPYLHPQDSLSFFYSMYCANLAKELYEVEQQTTYDVVMRLRFDCVFNEPIDLTKYITNERKMFVANDFFNDLGMSDRLAIGSSKLMNTYTNVYLHMEELVKRKEMYLQNEFVIGYWVQKKNNIPVDRVDISYYIRRK